MLTLIGSNKEFVPIKIRIPFYCNSLSCNDSFLFLLAFWNNGYLIRRINVMNDESYLG